VSFYCTQRDEPLLYHKCAAVRARWQSFSVSRSAIQCTSSAPQAHTSFMAAALQLPG
jgi:hypothetical protein